jgi:hypothetical protein
MTIHALVLISDSEPTRLTPNGIHSGMDITIQNANDSGYLYIGSQSVSSEDYGFRILPNHAISFELPGQESLYAIASNSGMKAAVLKTKLEKGS